MMKSYGGPRCFASDDVNDKVNIRSAIRIMPRRRSRRIQSFALVLVCSLLACPPLAAAWSSSTSSRCSSSSGCCRHQHHYLNALSPRMHHPGRGVVSHLFASTADASDDEAPDLEYLKSELLKYLEKRKAAGADERAKDEVGKTVGGTRGNPLLDYVSLAPNRGFTIEAAANAFDYAELEKYGYSYLSTPIMQAGGRLAMYDLLGLDKPSIVQKRKKKTAPEIIIDRTGETDRARYSGLKLGLLQDDSAQAEALLEAARKAKEGESLRQRIQEEDYVQPFADIPNVGSRQQEGYWTASRLDAWGKRKGESLAEMRRERENTPVLDSMETYDLGLAQRVYSIFTALLVATAFGKATPSLFVTPQDAIPFLDVLKAPAGALLLSAVGSCAFCAIQAPEKQRNAVVWAVKGLLGGPITVRQLSELPKLLTGRELGEQAMEE